MATLRTVEHLEADAQQRRANSLTDLQERPGKHIHLEKAANHFGSFSDQL